MSLDQTQLAELQQTLSKRYVELLGIVNDALDHGENQRYADLLDHVPADTGDMAVSRAFADLNLSILDKHVQEIREIVSARTRLTEGAFGLCIECGIEIDYARLQVAPTAKRCLICQTQWEKTHAHGETPSL